MGKYQDLTGLKFNRLTAIKNLGKNKRNVIIWLFKCDCGKEKAILGVIVKNGYTKSCGCLGKENKGKVQTERALRRPPGRAGADILWSELRGAARRRQKVFNLSKDDIFELCSKPCFYCNSKPSQIAEVNIKNWGKKTTQLHGRFIYNALDRVDNNLGYVTNNVVPCCPICNFAKHTLTEERFYNWIEQIHVNLKLKGLICGKKESKESITKDLSTEQNIAPGELSGKLE